MESILGLVFVFLLVAMNGFFVAAEFALVGARRTRIKQMVQEGSASAKIADRAIHHLDNYIAATQLGVTLASLALGWIGEPAVAQLLEPLFHAIAPEASAETLSHTIAVVVGFSFVTLVHIVMGELVPKSISLQRPEAVALIVARPVTWFMQLFRPVIFLMNAIGNRIVRLLGFEPAAGEQRVHSAEEIEMLVHSSREAGLLQESEETLLRRVFDFSDIRVAEIMQPRVEVDAIATNMSIREMVELIRSSHHSRYPVYEDAIDNVIGILLTQDLLEAVVSHPEMLTHQEEVPNVKPILRKPLFIPSAVGVDKLLEQMQESKNQLAIVVDEYGGMAGVATLEDVIEQLVGEVRDEFDEGEKEPIFDEGDETIVDGLVSMTEASERFGEPGGESESTTVGGYVAEKLNRIPVVGDTVPFGRYDMTVEKMDGMRVMNVRVVERFTPPAPQGESSTPETNSSEVHHSES